MIVNDRLCVVLPSLNVFHFQAARVPVNDLNRLRHDPSNRLVPTATRWEWEEYLKRQVHQLMGSDSIASVYLVEARGGEPGDHGE